MGGETLLTRRFHDFVDYMIDQGRFDLNFSFVTNGTTFDPELLEKLKKFKRVGIEVSIETITPHNSYVRQGTDTEQVLYNIDQYLTHCNNSNITVTVRPAISALTIGYYHTLLEYCAHRQLLVKSLVVTDPVFLSVEVLPREVRQNYLPVYRKLYQDLALDAVNADIDFNDSNPHRHLLVIKKQIQQCISLLENTQDLSSHLSNMVAHCTKWDQMYQYNARDLYPELKEVFAKHGYQNVPN
jgi:hypothetical protein